MIPHPRPNRVTPFGAFEAVAARGTMLGNRGDLHAADGSLSNRRWASKAWICCTLEPWKGNRVSFDAKGHYTPLFFLDEATALAAGHRPCALCRRADHLRFKDAWRRAQAMPSEQALGVTEIDGTLHRARIDLHGDQLLHAARLGDLPEGAMVVRPSQPEVAWLISGARLWGWSQVGYSNPIVIVPEEAVEVLTPAPIVAVLAAGYRPYLHGSAIGPPAEHLD